MNTTCLLLPAVALSIATLGSAQSGRTMLLKAPVVIGQTASIAVAHPPTLAGYQFALAFCSPSYPFSLPLSSPGVVSGTLFLDPQNFGVLGLGVLNASGESPALTFLVPNSPLLVGASFDVQGADVDGVGLVTLTDDELAIEVAAPPPANLNLAAIAPGTFSRGSTAVGGTAVPVHQVAITRPFWMGKFEVSQAEYQAVMGSNPSWFAGANRPVDSVSWFQAVAYCDALTVQEAAAGRLPSGYEYRLPTEAEWEYGCRAGTTTLWHFGASLSCAQANFYYDNTSDSFCSSSPFAGETENVGSYAPNAWGLHDLHGNVAEWCLDAAPNTYPSSAVVDPYVAAGIQRITRGGGLATSSLVCSSAARIVYPPAASNGYTGFRIVLAPVLP